MKKYWRDLGASFSSMSKPVRLTFIMMCLLPSLLLMPLAWYLALLSTSAVAQANLLTAARSGVKLDQAAFQTLVIELFSTMPGLRALIMATVALIAIGNVVFLLAHFAGVMAKRSASEVSSVSAKA